MLRVTQRLLGAAMASMLAGACATTPVTAPAAQISFSTGGYSASEVEGRQRRLPVFVDLWAAWCPSCLFIREWVFTDPKVTRYRGNFVWVELDVDDVSNGDFLARFPVTDLPALLIIDPVDGQPLAEWRGAVTPEQMERLLQDGERTFRERSGLSGLDQQLAEADRLDASGSHARAAQLYADALAHAPAGWAGRARAAQGRLISLRAGEDFRACAAEAATAAQGAPLSVWSGALILTGLECLEMAEPDAPWRPAAIAALLPDAERIAAWEGASPDLRSRVFAGVVSLRSERTEADSRHQWAARWLAFVEDSAAHAPSATGKASFNWARIEASKAVGEESRALPALVETERALPADWETPFQAAGVYEDLGRFSEALAANERALARARGASGLGVLDREARLQEKLGRVPAAIDALRRAVELGDSLPDSQKAPRLTARLKQRLEALRKQAVDSPR